MKQKNTPITRHFSWRRPAALVAACMSLISLAHAADFYIAPQGSDQNPGTKQKPFATLEAARDAIRALDKPAKADGVTVWIGSGTYALDQSFELDARDSGTEAGPIVYRAAEGAPVSLMGGRQIPASSFKPVTDSKILERLPAAVRSHVVQADLKALGIDQFSPLKYSGHLMPWVSAHSELYFNGERMTLARYPNKGHARTGKAVNGGTRLRSYAAIYWSNDLDVIQQHIGKPLVMPVYNADHMKDKLAQWKEADDIWVNLWASEYADMNLLIERIDLEKNNVHLAQPVNYGLRTKLPVTYFNLLEEIDQPGEWYLDRKNSMLYFYPPSAIKDVQLSLLEEPLIKMEGASDVTLDGLTLEATCGHAVQVIGGHSNRIADCTIRNAGINGVFMGYFSKEFYGPYYFLGAMFKNPYGVSGGGKDHVVENCEIYNVGYGGVFVASGDRLTLEPGNIVVRNNYIHHTQCVKKTNEAGISLYGVGNKALHNEIAYTPHFAIVFAGNDHVMEYNHIHHSSLTASDSGSIYGGRDVSFLGNTIRYNFLHDIGEKGNPRNVFGIYLDDKISGTLVSDNVFVRTGNAGLKLSGGYMHTIENNVFVDVPAIFIYNNYGRESFINLMNDPKHSHGLSRKLEFVNFDKAPYTERYPALKTIRTEGLPDNVVRNNLLLFRLKKRGAAAWLPKPKDGVNGGWVASYLEYANGRSNAIRDRSSLFPDNFVVNTSQDPYKTFDPGFVDEANLDYRFKPDSDVLKKLPNLKSIPFEKIGLQKDEYRK